MPVGYFWAAREGLKMFRRRFGSSIGSFFWRFSWDFPYQNKDFGGSFVALRLFRHLTSSRFSGLPGTHPLHNFTVDGGGLAGRLPWNGFLAYNWKLPAYSGAFLLIVDNFSFSTYNWSYFAYNFSFLAAELELFCWYRWESASNKGLKGRQAEKLNCEQKSSNCK